MPAPPNERRVTRRSAARIVLLAGDEVLLQGDTDPGLPGSRFYQTPGGGIEAGEDPAQAACRELHEETGLVVGREELGAPIAQRLVTHGYSDRVLIQQETFYRLRVERFQPSGEQLTVRERARRVSTSWYRLDQLPIPVWPSELATLVEWTGPLPLDLGPVEESTVPV